jgi:hypothetical protein
MGTPESTVRHQIPWQRLARILAAIRSETYGLTGPRVVTSIGYGEDWTEIATQELAELIESYRCVEFRPDESLPSIEPHVFLPPVLPRSAIVAYKVIQAPGTDSLSRHVTTALDDGWQPLGPAQFQFAAPAGISGTTINHYVQTMVKYKEQP